jgi:hypothetical protein
VRQGTIREQFVSHRYGIGRTPDIIEQVYRPALILAAFAHAVTQVSIWLLHHSTGGKFLGLVDRSWEYGHGGGHRHGGGIQHWVQITRVRLALTVAVTIFTGTIYAVYAPAVWENISNTVLHIGPSAGMTTLGVTPDASFTPVDIEHYTNQIDIITTGVFKKTLMMTGVMSAILATMQGTVRAIATWLPRWQPLKNEAWTPIAALLPFLLPFTTHLNSFTKDYLAPKTMPQLHFHVLVALLTTAVSVASVLPAMKVEGNEEKEEEEKQKKKKKEEEEQEKAKANVTTPP